MGGLWLPIFVFIPFVTDLYLLLNNPPGLFCCTRIFLIPALLIAELFI